MSRAGARKARGLLVVGTLAIVGAPAPAAAGGYEVAQQSAVAAGTG